MAETVNNQQPLLDIKWDFAKILRASGAGPLEVRHKDLNETAGSQVKVKV
jgi:hypothetical protein